MMSALVLCTCLGLLAACGSEPRAPGASSAPAADTEAGGYRPVFTEADLDPSWEDGPATRIVFSGQEVRIDGGGASAIEGGVKISRGGVYVLEGTCEDGRVVADVEPGEALKIVLNGVSLACSTSAPLYIANGDAVIVLPADTQNVLADAAVYHYASEAVKEPNACVYGDDNLSIVGPGALTVEANFNNGIGSKDELRIASGTITVRAVNNALKGNDCVLIRDAVLSLESKGDGIKSDENKTAGHGVIEISGSRVEIRAADDALQAESRVTIPDGSLRIDARGKKVNCNGVVAIATGVLG